MYVRVHRYANALESNAIESTYPPPAKRQRPGARDETVVGVAGVDIGGNACAFRLPLAPRAR